MRVQLVHPAEELAAGHPRGQPLARQHERDGLALVAHPLERLERGVARPLAQDGVVARVPLAQLALDHAKRVGVVVYSEKNGAGHASERTVARGYS